jgi:phage-related baseplate assembly protein
MALIKQAAFAELHGVSRKTVTSWKQRGWLEFQGDLVDVEASNALLKKYRRDGIDPVTQPVTQDEPGNKSGSAKNQVTRVTIEAGESAEQAAVRLLVASGAEMSFEEARRVKENYLALLNQLEYDKESGAVVAVADVVKLVGEEYARVRTRLLAIPAEQAPRIQRLKTVLEVQDALQQIIVDALEELTRDGVGRTA